MAILDIRNVKNGNCMLIFDTDTGTRYTAMVIYLDGFSQRPQKSYVYDQTTNDGTYPVEIDVPGSKRFMRIIRIRMPLFPFNFAIVK